MSNYIPPDSYNVDLNFKEVIGTVDAHNVVLSFGDADEVNLASIDAVISTSFLAEVTTLQGNFAQIDCVITTDFNAEITAVVSNQFCSIDAVINTNFVSNVGTHFDINFVLGLNHLSGFGYQKALPALLEQHLRYGKSRFKAHNSAFIFERGLSLSNAVMTSFDKTLQLQQSVKAVFEETTKLSSDYQIVWQENDKRFIARTLVFEESGKLLINRQTDWDELIRKRKQITFNHEVAHVFEKRFTFEWDKGLEFITTDSIDWDVARPVYYRKSEIKPFPPTPIPEYVGSTDLNFVCLCHDVDSHNIVLNFGVDDCIPSVPNKNWWYIVNEIEVSRLDNGQKIHVFNGSYRTDRSSWCWSYNLTIPAFELSKLDPIAGQPVILKIVVNGYQHLMLLENRTRSRQFASETYNLSGRSVSALLDAPSSPPRAFLQQNERTSVQLVQAEIDRSAYPDLTLNWQLIDALGWIVPSESFSYSGLTPIKAIQEIAAAGGGFIYSEADTQAISIKPMYKKTYWDPIAISEYDILLPESIITEQSTDYEVYPDYNGITLTNDKTGQTGQIKRTGTSGDVLYESVNNRLFTSDQVMGSYGKSKLAKAGLVESHTFSMPLTSEIGQCKPADILAFNAEFWGVVDSVSVSFTYSKVTQSVTVERVNHE